MRINVKNNRLIDNILSVTANLICDIVDGSSNLAEIVEFLAWYLLKYCPWLCWFLKQMVKSQF